MKSPINRPPETLPIPIAATENPIATTEIPIVATGKTPSALLQSRRNAFPHAATTKGDCAQPRGSYKRVCDPGSHKRGLRPAARQPHKGL